jgi:hypothetical protein
VDSSDGSLYYVIGTTYPSYFTWVGYDLSTVACASPTVCVAADNDGHRAAGGGQDWNTSTIERTEDAKTVNSACSTKECVVVWSSAPVGSAPSEDVATVFNGKAWASPIDFTTPGAVTSISCYGTGATCVAGDDDGYATSFGEGVTPTSTNIDNGSVPLLTVDCPSTTECVADDPAGSLYVFPPRDGSEVVALPGIKGQPFISINMIDDQLGFATTSHGFYILGLLGKPKKLTATVATYREVADVGAFPSLSSVTTILGDSSFCFVAGKEHKLNGTVTLVR